MKLHTIVWNMCVTIYLQHCILSNQPYPSSQEMHSEQRPTPKLPSFLQPLPHIQNY